MLLEIKNLSVCLKDQQQAKTIIEQVNLGIEPESFVGLVGGSGSGKTTTGLAILKLLSPQLKIVSGEIFFDGRNLLKLPESQMRLLRGKDIGMVFQEPLYAFNPVFSIGYQIDEVLKTHVEMSGLLRQKRVLELLDIVGLKDPSRVFKAYPHQLSGGMRQRAMIAQAIAGQPKLIIADEPTSNLDVTLQAKIIELFRQLRREFNLSLLLITHDLGVVRHLTDRVIVMKEGHVVEEGVTKEVLNDPKVSYTKQLVEALI